MLGNPFEAICAEAEEALRHAREQSERAFEMVAVARAQRDWARAHRTAR
jgi:hypothetical protein